MTASAQRIRKATQEEISAGRSGIRINPPVKLIANHSRR